MERQLKELRSSLDAVVLENLEFNNDLRHKTLQKIQMEHRFENIHLPLLQLLNRERTGYELSNLLVTKGIMSFENNEGQLYTKLHKMEQNGFLSSTWNNEGEKFYSISRRGKRALSKSKSINLLNKTDLSKPIQGGF